MVKSATEQIQKCSAEADCTIFSLWYASRLTWLKQIVLLHQQLQGDVLCSWDEWELIVTLWREHERELKQLYFGSSSFVLGQLQNVGLICNFDPEITS